jgi:hypothetical protein
MNTIHINLEILGTVQTNERVGTEGAAVFVVYKPTLYTTVARRARGETRALNVDRLELCVHHALAQLRGMCHAAHARGAIPDDVQRSIDQLARHLTSATGGLVNLMATYSDDVSTSARIRALVEAVATQMLDLGLPTVQLAIQNKK